MRKLPPAIAVLATTIPVLGVLSSPAAETRTSGLPNLALTGHMTFRSVHDCRGVTVTADLLNDSDITVGPFKAGLLIDLEPALQTRVESMDPGELQVLVFRYRHPVMNETDASVMVDIDDRIRESDEDDNFDGDTLFSICGPPAG